MGLQSIFLNKAEWVFLKEDDENVKKKLMLLSMWVSIVTGVSKVNSFFSHRRRKLKKKKVNICVHKKEKKNERNGINKYGIVFAVSSEQERTLVNWNREVGY